MKKKHCTLLFCLLLLGLLVALLLHKKNMASKEGIVAKTIDGVAETKLDKNMITIPVQETQICGQSDVEADVGRETGVHEPWIRPFSANDTPKERMESFLKITEARYAEFKLYPLKKNEPPKRGNRTEEGRGELIEEDDDCFEPCVIWQIGMKVAVDGLSLAWQRANGSTIPSEELERIKHWIYTDLISGDGLKIARIHYGPPATDEDMAFMNKIIERLNEVGKTNELLRNYWGLSR